MADEASNPPNLPPYSDMILAAISALGEKEGSSEEAIASYIETTYGELPDNYPELVSATLAKMKESGEVIFSDDNYLRPGSGSETPLKRGRGRPPKAKTPVSKTPTSDDAEPSAKRPRGRPAKLKDSLEAVAAKQAEGSPRPRGRPPKSTVVSPGTPGSVKKGRGRPPKVASPVSTPSGVKKSGRGRPPKVSSPAPANTPTQTPGGSAKRGRGRPPGSGSSKKSRGRPSKAAGSATKSASKPVLSPAADGSVKRGRGRPPKVQPNHSTESPAAEVAAA